MEELDKIEGITAIPDEMLDEVTAGRLQTGWKKELRHFMEMYKDKGYSCGRFLNLIKGDPHIFGASGKKERQTVINYVNRYWDKI